MILQRCILTSSSQIISVMAKHALLRSSSCFRFYAVPRPVSVFLDYFNIDHLKNL